MTDIIFKWDTIYHCWKNEAIKCLSNIFKVYIHKYPENQYLISIEKQGYMNIQHTIMDSMTAAQNFIGLRYNGLVKFRDSNEEAFIEYTKAIS